MARIAIRWLFRSRRGGLMVAAAVGLVCSAAVVTWALAVSIAHRQPADHWTIHEWGTFTALQNDAGVAAGGINVDDEPLPAFVHDLYAGLIQRCFCRKCGCSIRACRYAIPRSRSGWKRP